MPEQGPDDGTLREALLGQLAYLIDEIEALKTVVRGIPDPLQTARPLADDLTVCEYYGLLAVYDEAVYGPRLQAIVGGGEVPRAIADDRALAAGWNDHPLEAILDRVQQARGAFLEALRALPPGAWTRAVYALTHAATQHDVDLLRAVSQRLYEGRAKGEQGRA